MRAEMEELAQEAEGLEAIDQLIEASLVRSDLEDSWGSPLFVALASCRG